MPSLDLGRRALLTGLAALVATGTRGFAQGAPSIHVFKDPNCGCCSAWIDIVARAGFQVTTENLSPAALADEKAKRGVPGALASCHTAEVEGYVIEGHVPVADILRLLQERPAARGLSVPGMPFGSPGMGPEDAREAYEVVLIRLDGTSEVFTRYDAA